LSISFEVGKDIVKVDSTGGWRPPRRRGVWGQAPSGAQGQSPVGDAAGEAPGRKMNLTFSHCQKLPFLREILTSLTSRKEH